MNTDGNIVALNRYLANLDEQDAEDRRLEKMRADLSDDLLNGLFSGNSEVLLAADIEHDKSGASIDEACDLIASRCMTEKDIKECYRVFQL